MSTTLYTAPGAAGLVVHWLLIELDMPHELRLLDFAKKEQKSPEYLKLNPAGVVPTLVFDGQVLNEAAAIVMHLADTHPAAGLAPALATTERARYYQWMFFCANTLQPAFRAWWYPSEPAGEANIEAAKASARTRIEAGFERVDAHLAANGPYLLGEHISALSPQTRTYLGNVQAALVARGSDPSAAVRQSYIAAWGMVQRQAAMLAFLDTFRAMAVVFLLVLPFLLIMKRPSHHRGTGGVH